MVPRSLPAHHHHISFRQKRVVVRLPSGAHAVSKASVQQSYRTSADRFRTRCHKHSNRSISRFLRSCFHAQQVVETRARSCMYGKIMVHRSLGTRRHVQPFDDVIFLLDIALGKIDGVVFPCEIIFIERNKIDVIGLLLDLHQTPAPVVDVDMASSQLQAESAIRSHFFRQRGQHSTFKVFQKPVFFQCAHSSSPFGFKHPTTCHRPAGRRSRRTPRTGPSRRSVSARARAAQGRRRSVSGQPPRRGRRCGGGARGCRGLPATSGLRTNRPASR